jgi:hypothetical protein
VVVGVEADVLEVVVFAAGADALLGVGGAGVLGRADAGPLGDVGRRGRRGRSGTNWFMPALVKSSPGESGSSDADGTIVCPGEAKKSRKDWRISAEVMCRKTEGGEQRRAQGLARREMADGKTAGEGRLGLVAREGAGKVGW